MPDLDLIAIYELTLPGGEVLVLEQTLWGQVVAVHEARLGPARYPLTDGATRALRGLLEASSLYGVWGRPPGDPLEVAVQQELQVVIQRLYGDAPAW